MVRNLQMATTGLQQDLVAGEVTKVSVCTVRCKSKTYISAREVVGDVLWLLYFLWQRKPGVCGGQDSFNQVFGNTKRKHCAMCEGLASWVSLDLPAAQ